MRAGTGISGEEGPAGAARSASRAALEAAGLERAEAAILFATADHGPGLSELLDAAAATLGVPPVGATAHAVLVSGSSQETGPGVAVLALGGVDAEPFLLDRIAGLEATAGERLAHRLSAEIGPDDLLLLLPDPYALSPAPLLQSLRALAGESRLVGAGAVAGPATPPAQWAEGELATGALSGLLVRSAHPRIAVTQACQPVTGPLRVTRSDGHWILELDGRPALDVFRETARGPLAEDLRRAAAFVLLALPEPGDPAAALRAGDYRVRNVAGFSERGLAVAEPVKSGETVAFVLREPHGARDDLKRMLGSLAGARADFALYLDCCARGAALFGVPGLEAAYLQEALGRLPVLGMLGAYEIGPVRGRSELLTYTGVLALAGGGGQEQAVA